MHLLTLYHNTSSNQYDRLVFLHADAVAVVPLHTPRLPLLLFALVFPLLLLYFPYPLRAEIKRDSLGRRAAVQGEFFQFDLNRLLPIVVCASWTACKNTFLNSSIGRLPISQRTLSSSSLNLSRGLTTSAANLSLYCPCSFSFSATFACFHSFLTADSVTQVFSCFLLK